MWRSAKAKPEQTARYTTNQVHEPRVHLSSEDLAQIMNDKDLPKKVGTFLVSVQDGEIDKLRLFTTARFVPMDEFIKLVKQGTEGLYAIERQSVNGGRFVYLVSFYVAAVTVREGQTLKDAFLEYLNGAFPDTQRPQDWDGSH